MVEFGGSENDEQFLTFLTEIIKFQSVNNPYRSSEPLKTCTANGRSKQSRRFQIYGIVSDHPPLVTGHVIVDGVKVTFCDVLAHCNRIVKVGGGAGYPYCGSPVLKGQGHPTTRALTFPDFYNLERERERESVGYVCCRSTRACSTLVTQ